MNNYAPSYNCLDLTRVRAICQRLLGAVTERMEGETK